MLILKIILEFPHNSKDTLLPKTKEMSRLEQDTIIIWLVEIINSRKDNINNNNKINSLNLIENSVISILIVIKSKKILIWIVD